MSRLPPSTKYATCKICGATYYYQTKTVYVCAGCQSVFKPTWILMTGQVQAHRAVDQAKNDGVLPHLKYGDVLCVDCGKVAQVYDHRDYNKPLDVDPVCRGCNVRRGAAVYVCGDYEKMQHLVYQFVRVWGGPGRGKESSA